MYDIKEETKIEKDDYFIQQFKSEDLSQFSYYIESDQEAVIIDPIRDVDFYLSYIEARRGKLKYVIESRFHADFVSGHLELYRKSGVKIIFGSRAATKLDIIRLNEGEEISLGRIKLKIMDTPVPTSESISVILYDSKLIAKTIFTGDCLFDSKVGRPDLSVEENSKKEALAGILYESIQRIKSLPDDVVIFPGHGAGSFCGYNIDLKNCDSLVNQKKTNSAMTGLSKSEFIKNVLVNVLEVPNYYFHVAKINRQGYEPLENIMTISKRAISVENFYKLLNEDSVVIDTRDYEEALKSFIKGSYIVSMKMPFSVWIAQLFPPDQKLVLIVDQGKEEEAICRIARVGYENVIGYLEGGFSSFLKFCKEKNLSEKFISSVEHIPDFEINHVVTSHPKYAALDVREEREWKSTGIIPNSHLISLKDLEKNISYLNAEERRDKTWAVYCRTGGRSACAASILKKYGYDTAYAKGIEFLKQHKVELTPYPSSNNN